MPGLPDIAVVVLQKTSAPQPAAVNVQHRAVEIIRIAARQKHAAARDVFRRAPAAFGNPVEDGLVPHRVFAQRLGVFRGDVAGRNGIDVDAFLCPSFDKALVTPAMPCLLAA